jgi:hypothetical protein
MDPDNSLAFDFLSTVFHKKNMPDQAFTASQKAKTLAGEFSREEMADMQRPTKLPAYPVISEKKMNSGKNALQGGNINRH